MFNSVKFLFMCVLALCLYNISASLGDIPDLLKDAVVLDPPNNTEHKYTIIFLHGLSGSGEGFKKRFENKYDNTRVILPNAPIRPVKGFNYNTTRAWYDIDFTRVGSVDVSYVDTEGILNSVKKIQDLIHYEAATLKNYEMVFLSGFSQGACMTMITTRNLEQNIGGAMAYSGYTALPDKSVVKNFKTPMMMYHGTQDQVVPIRLGRANHEYYKDLNVQGLYYVEEEKLDHHMVGKTWEYFTNFFQQHRNWEKECSNCY